MPQPIPLLIALVLIAAAIATGIIDGIGDGSALGGVLALAAIAPACVAMFGGMQHKTSYQVLYAVVLMFAGLGLGIALWALQIVAWVR